MLISLYTANLAAFMTTQRLKSPVENTEALSRHTDIKYGPVKGGATEAFFRVMQTYYIVFFLNFNVFKTRNLKYQPINECGHL